MSKEVLNECAGMVSLNGGNQIVVVYSLTPAAQLPDSTVTLNDLCPFEIDTGFTFAVPGSCTHTPLTRITTPEECASVWIQTVTKRTVRRDLNAAVCGHDPHE